MSNRKYDSAFKREAVHLADQSSKSDFAVENDLGVCHGLIGRWRTKLKTNPKDAFPGSGHQTELEEENRRLRRERNDACMERDILKKAIAIFSKTQKTGTAS